MGQELVQPQLYCFEVLVIINWNMYPMSCPISYLYLYALRSSAFSYFSLLIWLSMKDTTVMLAPHFLTHYLQTVFRYKLPDTNRLKVSLSGTEMYGNGLRARDYDVSLLLEGEHVMSTRGLN
jgi:hypothetical protein